jgi:tRNA threonylcarbamoyladenosine biosynthesis protein TsaB
MLILTIRSDNPEAEVGLFNDLKKIDYKTWAAHRQLAETIHQKIKMLLYASDKEWSDIEALVVYKGPGSFTGLRIGLTVADSIAFASKIPIVGFTGENWIEAGLNKLISGGNDKSIIPMYGAPVHITKPKR